MVSQDSVHLLIRTPVSRVNILCHRSISCVHTLVHIGHAYSMYCWKVYWGARNKPSHWVRTPCHKQHASIGLLAYMLHPMCTYTPSPSSLPATKYPPPTIISSHHISHLSSLSLSLSLSLSHVYLYSLSLPPSLFPSLTPPCLSSFLLPLYLYCTMVSLIVYKRAILLLYVPRGGFYKHTHPSGRRRQCSMCVCPNHAHTRPTVLTIPECNTVWRLNMEYAYGTNASTKSQHNSLIIIK